ncbi:hypothetical protein UNPF46_30730 [Bradyrhizobium sp. UNPF46]|uniref:hypothetical protein n=1 Tax=Bradyrhizobium sp. UNPF46 TaxID=1141168 RepID=UPI00115415D3|nr:hypothetical protein [Bradyrhizobium sp. UNPF46]TQF27439.1 hypothetical protein UNPF46_30730 [Bradyrhizobium sp. UNPF46]
MPDSRIRLATPQVACRTAFVGMTLLASLCPQARAQSEAEILSNLRGRATASFVATDGKEKRYVGQHCEDVKPDSTYWNDVLADYHGLRVQDCRPEKSYTSSVGRTKVSVNARALVLLPSAEMVAATVFQACRRSVPDTRLQECADTTLTHILESNGAQFVVSGLITEPKSEGYGAEERWDPICRKTKDEDVLFSFRDGVTVRLVGRDRTSWRASLKDGCKALAQPTEIELEEYLRANVASVKNYGRITDMHRDAYASCTNASDLKAPNGDGAWRALVKANFIQAWKTGEDKILNEWVRAKFLPTESCSLK